MFTKSADRIMSVTADPKTARNLIAAAISAILIFAIVVQERKRTKPKGPGPQKPGDGWGVLFSEVFVAPLRNVKRTMIIVLCAVFAFMVILLSYHDNFTKRVGGPQAVSITGSTRRRTWNRMANRENRLTFGAGKAAQGIEAEIPQTARRAGEELERIARSPAKPGMRPVFRVE